VALTLFEFSLQAGGIRGLLRERVSGLVGHSAAAAIKA
jgi:hypothetical protein